MLGLQILIYSVAGAILYLRWYLSILPQASFFWFILFYLSFTFVVIRLNVLWFLMLDFLFNIFLTQNVAWNDWNWNVKLSTPFSVPVQCLWSAFCHILKTGGKQDSTLRTSNNSCSNTVFKVILKLKLILKGFDNVHQINIRHSNSRYGNWLIPCSPIPPSSCLPFLSFHILQVMFFTNFEAWLQPSLFGRIMCVLTITCSSDHLLV